VAAEGRVHLVRGGSPPARLWRLTLGQLREGLLRVGGLTQQQVEATERLLDDPAFVFTNLTVWAVRGQHP
jgi:hypothetical protein